MAYRVMHIDALALSAGVFRAVRHRDSAPTRSTSRYALPFSVVRGPSSARAGRLEALQLVLLDYCRAHLAACIAPLLPPRAHSDSGVCSHVPSERVRQLSRDREGE